MNCFRTSPALAGHICCGLVLCLLIAGCGDAGTQGTVPAGSAPSAPAATPEASEKALQSARSKDLLNSILSMLKLESLGITAKESELVGLMNQWQRFSHGNQASEEEVALDEAVLEAWRARLTERQLKLVRRATFQLADVERLRNVLLVNAVMKQSIGKGRNDLERVTNVFNNLIRNTELISSHPDEVPLSPYQIYLVGKATAADRAWIFAEMLRQLKIDTVILSAPLPKDAESWDAAQPFVVGVLLENQVYLFDTRLGLPLTGTVQAAAAKDGAAKQGEMANPLTLEQVRANPDILKSYALAEDKPYGVTAEMLKAPGVFVVGDAGLWSYRFRELQEAFTGSHAMIISDPLIDLNGQQGQFTRVTKWSGQPWTVEQVAVWDYPDSQLSGLESLSAQHQQTLTRLTDEWKTPVIAETVKTETGTTTVARATNLFLFARLDHAQGKLEDAVAGYTRVRVQLKQPTGLQHTERLGYAYQMAYEDALFWTGVAKFDQGSATDRRVATDKLQQYVKLFPKGQWADTCHVLLAELAALAGDPPRAVAEIQLVAPDHPQHAGHQFLRRAWERATPAVPTTEK